MSKIKTHVNKGDTVKVITGNNKGKEGTVLSVRTVTEVLQKNVHILLLGSRYQQSLV
jgi:ribosomal protein L24